VEPTRDDDAVVDLLDVLLRDGAMIQADIIVTVADVPLIGINLRAAVAGMATMREYGFFEDWDAATRTQAVGEQRAATRREKFVPREESGTHGRRRRPWPRRARNRPISPNDAARRPRIAPAGRDARRSRTRGATRTPSRRGGRTIRSAPATPTSPRWRSVRADPSSARSRIVRAAPASRANST
jgi:hypothetical protein